MLPVHLGQVLFLFRFRNTNPISLSIWMVALHRRIYLTVILKVTITDLNRLYAKCYEY